MIFFTEIGRYGRLGNQLYQYAILKSVSLRKGYRISMPLDLSKREWHGQKCLLENFKLPSTVFTDLRPKRFYNEKDGRTYFNNVYDIEDDTGFHGFFQHPKYYEDIQDDLIHEFELKDEINHKVKNFLSNYGENVVSLHVRRGDMCDGTNPIDTKWSNDFSDNSFLKKYYLNALSEIPKNSTVLLFTGGSRDKDNKNDLIWCEKNFNDDRIIFVDNLSDIESFGVMSNCKYNITSFASTFSWWASFLNRNKNIIAPKNYYPSHNINSENIYPSNWKLI